jgi:hypothetical protein
LLSFFRKVAVVHNFQARISYGAGMDMTASPTQLVARTKILH